MTLSSPTYLYMCSIIIYLFHEIIIYYNFLPLYDCNMIVYTVLKFYTRCERCYLLKWNETLNWKLKKNYILHFCCKIFLRETPRLSASSNHTSSPHSNCCSKKSSRKQPRLDLAVCLQLNLELHDPERNPLFTRDLQLMIPAWRTIKALAWIRPSMFEPTGSSTAQRQSRTSRIYIVPILNPIYSKVNRSHDQPKKNRDHSSSGKRQALEMLYIENHASCQNSTASSRRGARAWELV